MNRLAAKISEQEYGVTLVAAVFVVLCAASLFLVDRFVGGGASVLLAVVWLFVLILLLPVLKQAKLYGMLQQTEELLHDAGVDPDEREKVKEALEDALNM